MKIKLNNGLSLVSLYAKKWAVHLGVRKDPTTVYKEIDGRLQYVDCDWVWGRATEPYDLCIEYFGLGPLLLVCWAY